MAGMWKRLSLFDKIWLGLTAAVLLGLFWVGAPYLCGAYYLNRGYGLSPYRVKAKRRWRTCNPPSRLSRATPRLTAGWPRPISRSAIPKRP